MAKNNNRDDFTPKTKSQLAKRAGWLCSDPSCRRPTIGSNSDGNNEINLGTAAHICAAAPGGPRYDPNQTLEQRRSPDNGIWMCKLHGTAVDAPDSMFTVELLREWKAKAQKDSLRRVLYNDVQPGPVRQAPTEIELSTHLRAAAVADMEVFQRSAKWPSTSIALTLEVDGLNGPVSTPALATALTTLDDLILVAPPGTGKTTTLFQIAQAVLTNSNASPIIISLGDWSTDTASLLESVLKRPAFQGISQDDLRTVAANPGVILLLDGWNELDAAARKRLAVQVERLQAELPELSFLISTRQQALDVPVHGTRINLLPLSETQQLEIAQALRGDAGVRMLDQAWRTTGVRELVTIPLYLKALLTLSEDAPFPTTKEEVLHRFVAVHEKDMQRAESLAEMPYDLHQRFLEDLATTTTRAGSTTITENIARRSVSETVNTLVAEGQITGRPQPHTVLEALVSHHMLVRVSDPASYSFQHQQFLEWYASHFVERLILTSIGNAASCDKLKVEVLDQPTWEESILFACERLARGDQKQQEACATVILRAFEVDPMLAAEIIFRTTDATWARVGSTIQGLIRRWHTPGKIDRALRFTINSGRTEFFDQVWPLITHEDDQVRLCALRCGKRFPPSLLGRDAAKRIEVLPPDTRKHILHELASNNGIDGIDLAAAMAKNDQDPEVKATVIDALVFRRAKRHVVDVLNCADERTFDLVVHKDLVDGASNEHINKGIEAARARQQKRGVTAYVRLRSIIDAQGHEDLSGELTAVIAEMEIDKKSDTGVAHLLYEVRNRYSRAIADGLLQRVRAGRTLFYGAGNLLASADVSLEDDALLEIALAETSRNDARAEAAASVLGPQAVGCMIKTVFEAKKRVHDASGQYNQAASDRYYDLLSRIAHTPGASLIAAVRARSEQAGDEEMADLAELISRHPDGENDRGRPFDAEALAAISALAENWGNRMLASAGTTRSQLASMARLVSKAPSVSLLPLLKRLLDEELRRYRAFREEAIATDWRQGSVTDEARMVHAHGYQRAFDAINVPQTAELMREYLQDEHFGQLAALVLAAQWTAKNEPDGEKRFWGRVNFSRVEEKRVARASDPAATSTEAEAIFGVIEPFIADEATGDQKKHAVALGVVAARLPHGQRDATIQKLLSLAPRRLRATLLQNLILSGEVINIELVKHGIAEVFEAAKTQRWILSEGYELKEWLRLLPFAIPITEAFTVVRDLPDDQRKVVCLEEMIVGFGTVSGDDAENVLFQLAQANPKLYANCTWRDAAIGRTTLSAARRFVDLAASGAFEGHGIDHWHMARQIGGLIDEQPQLRAHIYQLLKDGATTPGLELLAQTVAENPDAEGLLLLIKIKTGHKHSFISVIEKVVTKQVSSEDWKGAYNIVAIPAVELRRDLLAMTNGCPTDVAARCLNQIDKLRDAYGRPDSEPRHPDLLSGKQWPIIIQASDRTE